MIVYQQLFLSNRDGNNMPISHHQPGRFSHTLMAALQEIMSICPRPSAKAWLRRLIARCQLEDFSLPGWNNFPVLNGFNIFIHILTCLTPTKNALIIIDHRQSSSGMNIYSRHLLKPPACFFQLLGIGRQMQTRNTIQTHIPNKPAMPWLTCTDGSVVGKHVQFQALRLAIRNVGHSGSDQGLTMEPTSRINLTPLPSLCR